MPVDPDTLPDAPEPRLSPLRVLVALVVLCVVGAAGFLGVRRHEEHAEARAQVKGAARAATWFAPYVDTTLTPTSAFQDRAQNPARDVVLGFVVAADASSCTPTWGTFHTLEQAGTQLDLDRRVAQVRGQGGSAIVSFGGAANSELAVACKDPGQLTQAYASVVERYGADTIDLDIEGAALADVAANARRATAIATVQAAARKDEGRLAVWLTLPVTPKGLQPDALAVVRAMLAAKVDLAGVNIMAMDFGRSRPARQDMREAILAAADASRRQLSAVFAQGGVRLDGTGVWHKLGITVMIGQNDVPAERVTVADARAVAAYARDHGVARVSLWSLNRDQRCGATFAVIGTLSNYCSGVAQRPLAFSTLFTRALKGSAAAQARAVTVAATLPEARTAPVDDPKRSPYPIWSPESAYKAGTRIVWHGAVYTARWYTQGQTPDQPGADPAGLPWALVGPVLRTDRAPSIAVPEALQGLPSWLAGRSYQAGARVLFGGLPYQAKWYVQGDEPTMSDAGSAWKPLFQVPGVPKA